MSKTITHEVVIDGEVRYTTQLPVGMDPDEYDRLVKQMDELVSTEASAGRRGAEARLELAVRLQLDSPELAGKTWRQLVQEPAYMDGVSHINAKHGKAKSAYSNHLTELRESKDQLRRFFGMRFSDKLTTPEAVTELVEEWYLDPNREKNGGGKKKVAPQGQEEPVQASEPDDADVDDSTDSLVGLMSATETRLNNEPIKDLPLDIINQLNSLIRAAERCKSAYLTHIRGSGN